MSRNVFLDDGKADAMCESEGRQAGGRPIESEVTQQMPNAGADAWAAWDEGDSKAAVDLARSVFEQMIAASEDHGVRIRSHP